MNFDEDLAAFFGDLAQTATIVTGTGTSTARVYLDEPGTLALGGGVVVDSPSVICTAALGLVRGSMLTIGAQQYSVRQVEKLDDGTLVRAALALT